MVEIFIGVYDEFGLNRTPRPFSLSFSTQDDTAGMYYCEKHHTQDTYPPSTKLSHGRYTPITTLCEVDIQLIPQLSN